MSRRRSPARRWHVGDRCRAPYEAHIPAGLQRGAATRTFWNDGEVVAVRGDRVVVRYYRWESVHPWWELKEPPRPKAA